LIEEYMDAVSTIIDILGSRKIYVILDLHQDLWHREYCGEGVPDYLQESCANLGIEILKF
jgi:endoglycosylceramidase